MIRQRNWNWNWNLIASLLYETLGIVHSSEISLQPHPPYAVQARPLPVLFRLGHCLCWPLLAVAIQAWPSPMLPFPMLAYAGFGWLWLAVAVFRLGLCLCLCVWLGVFRLVLCFCCLFLCCSMLTFAFAFPWKRGNLWGFDSEPRIERDRKGGRKGGPQRLD